MFRHSARPQNTGHLPLETRNIDITELDALIERIKQAQANTLALSPEDLQLVLNCLLSLLTMQTQLSSKNITIRKLQKLAGMIRADERLSQLVSAANRPEATTTSEADSEVDSEVDSEESAPKDKKPRRQNKPQVPTKTEFHALTELQKNMNWLVCGTGTLSKYAPAEFISPKQG